MACRGYYVDSFSSVLRPTPDGWPSSLLSRRSSVFHNAVEEAAENGGGPRLREATKKKITGTFPKHFQSVKRLFAFFFVLPALRVTSAPCGPGGPCCGTVPTRVQCFLSLSLSLSLSVFLFFPFCLGNFYKWTTCRAPGSVACQQLEGGALGGARWRTPATPSSSSTSSVDAVKTSCKRITSDTFFFFVCVCVCVFAVVSSPAGRTSYPPTYLGQRSGRNKKIDSSYRIAIDSKALDRPVEFDFFFFFHETRRAAHAQTTRPTTTRVPFQSSAGTRRKTRRSRSWNTHQPTCGVNCMTVRWTVWVAGVPGPEPRGSLMVRIHRSKSDTFPAIFGVRLTLGGKKEKKRKERAAVCRRRRDLVWTIRSSDRPGGHP